MKTGAVIISLVLLTGLIIGGWFYFSGGGVPQPIELSESQFSIGKTVTLDEGQKVKFEIGEDEHSITINSIFEDSVSVTIRSKTIGTSLFIGETKKFDLDDDRFYDLKVKLREIEDGKPQIFIKEIHEQTEMYGGDRIKECIKAGQLSFDESTGEVLGECCEGLTEIGDIHYDEDKTCEEIFMIVGYGSICSDCGNDICEEWENRCNCAEDCEITCRDEEYECTIFDIPCCGDLKEVALAFPDEDGQCIAASCGSICLPCGNGVCDEDENECNCPEDCETIIPDSNSYFTMESEGVKYTIELISGTDTSATLKVTDSEGNVNTKEISEKVFDYTFNNVDYIGDLLFLLTGADENTAQDYISATFLVGVEGKNMAMGEGVEKDLENTTFIIDDKKYVLELVAATDFEATIKVTDSKGDSDSRFIGIGSSKDILDLRIMVEDADEYTHLSSISTTFSVFTEKNLWLGEKICAGQGEWIDFTDASKLNKCCEGLKNVHTTDSLSVADECYWVGTATGYPGGVCSNCGNGVCEEIESVCGCADDCVGKGKSEYNTIKEFCNVNVGYEHYCEGIGVGELELCDLC